MNFPDRSSEYDDQSSGDPDLDVLRQMASNLASSIEATKESLWNEEEIESGTFKLLARRFSDISAEFIAYLKRLGSPRYKAITSSSGRQTAAQGIVNHSRQTAKLFESYWKHPENYSPVDIQAELSELSAQVDNLRTFSSSRDDRA